MIDSVRNTVLSVLNKNNFGYISPSDFNLFAEQAQLEIFNGLMPTYNELVNKENARVSGTEYADLKKGIEETIDYFSVTKSLLQEADNEYYLPSLLTTSDDYHLVNKVLCYDTFITSGASTSGGGGGLEDSNADFVTDGVEVGDIISVITVSGTVAEVTVTAINPNGIRLETTNGSVWVQSGQDYAIYRGGKRELERVSHSKIHLLNSSLLTSPTLTYPAYTMEDLSLKAYPSTISNVGQVIAQYIRYPLAPKWTFVSLTNGTPVFDQSQNDYQDFELPISEETSLVNKILEYAGISIREIAPVEFAKANEMTAKDNE